MDSAVWGFVGVIVGGIITGAVTIWAEKLRADKAASLDSARRQDDRRLARDNFQRETLVALQDAVGDHARQSFEIYLRTRERFDATGRWYAGPIAPDLDEAERQARLRVATLRSRVADEETRSLAREMIDASAAVLLAETEAAGDAALGRSATSASALMERSGDLIVATFVKDTPSPS